MNKPYSIKIFLPGGDPDGLRTIEKSNWSGAGIIIPRSLMTEARQRRELSRTGVYVLSGPPEDSGLPRIYVGEGDPIKPRLEQHAAKKDFWTSCIAFTSKDENLNKAHVQFLESRLVELAAGAKRCLLDNGNVPALPSLSESDAADAEGFLSEILLCCPLLGLSVFSATSTPQKSGKTLYLAGKGMKAQGVETSEGLLVQSGSGSAKGEAPSCSQYIRALRATLLSNGVLKPADEGYVFTQDYMFNSPSTAAGVILGRSANGRIEWKTKTGKTLKEQQETQAEE
ncbi:MAG: DUF4357 domain-containing protein [Candidatus Riflebacteria bacterium HGW-Riflebacteria-2]|nr:MAG: DUF4357 domain-containing protein [Candidatus Riflebacteria bacterium HGW-Riflebacteria-2]